MPDEVGTTLQSAQTPVTVDTEKDRFAPVTVADRRNRARLLASYGVLLTFAAVFVFFSIDLPHVFLTGQNLANILNTAAVPALLAVGLTIPLVIGDFDLSVGSGASLGGALAIVLMAQHGWSPLLAVGVALLVGLAFGTLNGVLIAVLGASSFIITLAMGSVLVGLEFLLTKQQTIIIGIPLSFVNFGTAAVGGVQVPVFITLGIALALAFLLAQTPFGRYVRATGANPAAARSLGLPVRRLRVVALVVSGVCAALAGVFIVAVAGNSFPNAGEPNLLPAFAAAFLGSTLFPSRQFSLVGAWIAAWLLEMVATGLVELNLASWTINVFNGLVLIIAIVAALRGRSTG